MPVIISNIRSSLDEKPHDIIMKALKSVCVPACDTRFCEIYKTSLDARRQSDIHFVHSIIIELKDQLHESALCKKYACCSLIESSGLFPVISNIKKDGEVVIVGFGPAGMFAGLILAEYGYHPVIFERGEAVDERIESVNNFWSGGKLNENSNVQFGEGGAGTFSDGKLTTRIHDPLCRVVLERLIQFGAPKDIIFKAKPHIGTDNLRKIVKAVRKKIIEAGGIIHFKSAVDNVTINNGKITSISSGGNRIQTKAAVLAVGHSARDTFEMLISNNIHIESKPFSVGARIEHRQEDVDFSLYGKNKDNPLLPRGEYQLSYRNPAGRAVYTFCMCPGGFVVPSSSEPGGVVTNGMSEYLRNGKNANAALVVSVSKADFGNLP
ncbi:MAG: NAD(P)/FAD-dependent oxidoreductase, partial [Oscillospiraceae bacterium]